MVNHSCPMSRTSSWASRVMMDMCGTMAWSTPWTRWVVVSVAMAWTTSGARWVIVNPLVLGYIFGFCANLCAMNRGIFGVFGVLCALHLKKLNCRGIVILLDSGSQIILTGLAAHTEQVGQQRYNEDTAHNPQGHKGMELGRREFQGRGVSVALRALLGAVLSTRDFRSLVTWCFLHTSNVNIAGHLLSW